MDVQRPFIPKKNWSFHNPVKVQFGRGCRKLLLSELEGLKLLLVTTSRGRKQFCEDEVLSQLVKNNKIIWVDTVRENPGLTYLQKEIERLRQDSFDVLVAFGGGSSMDAGKTLAIALSESCQGIPLEHLLEKPDQTKKATPRPLYAIPTTAGTGSEVTPFATVWNHEQKKKLSLSGDKVYPYAAYVDPALTDSVLLDVTLSTGLDAINQAAESIWNKNANSITFGYASQALKLGFSALPQLLEGSGGESERDQMAECSLLAGLAISHTRTALCHSMSYPITAHFGVPHGLACAFTMLAVLKLNVPEDPIRFIALSEILGLDPSSPSRLIEFFETLHFKFSLKDRVNEFVPDLSSLLSIVDEMYTPGRADNNLASVDLVKIRQIILESWEGKF